MLGKLFAKSQFSWLAKLLRRGKSISKKLQQILKAELPRQRGREKGERGARIPMLYGQRKCPSRVDRLFRQAGQADRWLFRIFAILPDHAIAAALGRAKKLQAYLR